MSRNDPYAAMAKITLDELNKSLNSIPVRHESAPPLAAASAAAKARPSAFRTKPWA